MWGNVQVPMLESPRGPPDTRRGAAASTQEHEASTAKRRPVSRRAALLSIASSAVPYPPNLRP